MLIERLHLTNLLSYGPDSEAVELGPLNVLIGPNGSGKSNFMEALSLLQAAPAEVTRPIRDGGGIRDWLHKSSMPAKSLNPARLEAILRYPEGRQNLRYVMEFEDEGGRFSIRNEIVENEKPNPNHPSPYFYYRWNNGHPELEVKELGKRTLARESIRPDQSILKQKRDTDLYPEITYIAEQFEQMALYREWTFGRYATPRLPQKTDNQNRTLEPDGSNLGMFLNRLRRNPETRRVFADALPVIYDGIEDVDVIIEGGYVQVFVMEQQVGLIPATRLSDGTLRYLALLAVLCDPSPPPLICIEEPELGLHPDALSNVARLLRVASERTQLVVTTHSPILLDAFTDTPEAVLVCERDESGSHLIRLDREELKPWLGKYRLGPLWMRGELGGTRW